jgi:hypothetical protein
VEIWQLISCQISVIMAGAGCRRGRARPPNQSRGRPGREDAEDAVTTPDDSRGLRIVILPRGELGGFTPL